MTQSPCVNVLTPTKVCVLAYIFRAHTVITAFTSTHEADFKEFGRLGSKCTRYHGSAFCISSAGYWSAGDCVLDEYDEKPFCIRMLRVRLRVSQKSECCLWEQM